MIGRNHAVKERELLYSILTSSQKKVTKVYTKVTGCDYDSVRCIFLQLKLTLASVAMLSAESLITPRVWNANTQSSLVHTHGCRVKNVETAIDKEQMVDDNYTSQAVPT